MYCDVDESGNTGLELFDANQPTLYYGLLMAKANLDVVAEPLMKELRQSLAVNRLHANELGVTRLTTIADKLARFSKKNDLRFSMLRVNKPDHALISFFDQVFDSGMNVAVPWHHYFTPLRYILLFKVVHLFDDVMAKEAWKARRERNPARAAQMLTKLCNDLLPRVALLPDPGRGSWYPARCDGRPSTRMRSATALAITTRPCRFRRTSSDFSRPYKRSLCNPPRRNAGCGR